MKKCFFLILFMILTGFFSCGKLCGCYLPPELGVYAQKDSKAWRAAMLADTTRYDTVYLYAKTDSDQLKFRFIKTYVNNVTQAPKNYEVIYSVTNATRGKLTYVLDNTAPNDITVTYGSGEGPNNKPNTWITSDFNFTFKLASPTGKDAFDARRIMFSNGKIHLGLQN